MQLQSRAEALDRELGLSQTTLERHEVADQVLRREITERKAVMDAQLEQIRVKCPARDFNLDSIHSDLNMNGFGFN